ncbi:activating transcription factor of chaperone [Coccinella septempunctata]|uniref:activating transcription factor of chaperone n=1 Tax=Coccinella septempunctata TaxID=41139 RepID=UPI001D05DF27|nr:activating transcription factor of chaperone [Coccinella septempunctata]
MSSTVLTLPSWKQEPLSPPSSEDSIWASSSEEALFYSTLEQNVDLKLETDLFGLNDGDSKADVASQLLKDLEKLVDIDELIKEEPFFLDVKMLPVLDELDQSRYPVKVENFKAPSKSMILSEFDSVPMCDMIECAPATTILTPPQSPPSETTMLTTLKPLVATQAPIFQVFQHEQASSGIVPDKQPLDNVLVYQQVDYPEVVTPQPDIAHELAVVDELVRSRVENMQWSSGPSSPCSNSCSNSSYEDSCSSSDPEWVPEPIDNLNQPPSDVKTHTRKRSKPYSRTVEDKKSRKKEQNKNAATRYRLKKKAEVEGILSEEKQLVQQGEKLTNQITDIKREIKYLKGLMRDLFKAKGLIN